MSRKISIIITLILISQIFSIDGISVPQPIGIAGYVFLNSNPVPNATVNITNIDRGESVNTTTDSNGLFIASIFAEDGDRLVAYAKYESYSASKNFTANLSLVTHWVNITLSNISGSYPFCDWDYIPKNPKVNDRIQFIDYSYDPDGLIMRWHWDFGDGDESLLENPEHAYSRAGTYKVTLTVTDNDGLSSSRTRYITVYSQYYPEENDDIFIPPLPPPKYPERPYTIPQMYHMLRADRVGRGNGVKVAVIDTGTTYRNYLGIDMSVIKAYKISGIDDAFDEYGHGTWTTFAVLYGVYTWTNGEVYSIKVMEGNNCSYDAFLEGLRIAEQLGVDIVSISLGGAGDIHDEISKAIDRLRSKGIIVVASAGNFGPQPYTIVSPGLSPSAICVGAVDPLFTLDDLSDDVICEWSSRGPVQGLREVKPDCVAGGESILGPWLYDEIVVSGTSMSTPIVAGGCAVIYAKWELLFKILKFEYFFHKRIVPWIFEKSLEWSCYGKGEPYSYGAGIPRFDSMEKIIFLLALLFILLPFIIIAVVVILIYRYIKKK